MIFNVVFPLGFKNVKEERDRCDAAIEWLQRLMREQPAATNIIVLTAGMYDAQRMADYILAKVPDMFLRVRPAKTLGTLEEIEEAVSVIASHSDLLQAQAKEVVVYPVTNPEHMPRVRFIWNHLKHEGWSIRERPVSHHFSFFDRVIEIPKFVVVFLRITLMLWRRA